jgi:autotransporter-associated beta strand protein
MRKNATKKILAAAVTSTALLTSVAHANDYNWTGGDATNPTHWDVGTSINWNDDTTGPGNPSAWFNSGNRATPSRAYFGGAGGTVQIIDNIDLDVLRFNSNGYVLDPASTGMLSSGAAANITLGGGADGTIGAVIADGSSFGVGGGTTGLVMSSTGLITLGGTNTYTGGTTLNSGTLAISDLANLGTGTVTFNGASGYLGIAGTTLTNITGRIANPTTFTGGFNVIDPTHTFSLATALSGSGQLQKAGAGTLLLSAVNTNTGTNTVHAGSLKLDTGASLGTGKLQVNGGALDLNGQNQSVADLAGAGGTVTNRAASTLSTLTVTPTSSSTTFGGTITDNAGSVAVVKAGTTTLALTGNNTYSGGTTVNGGTLLINSDASLGATSGSLTINGGTLNVTSPVTLDAARGVVIGAGGATLSNTSTSGSALPGSFTNVVALTINGPLSGSGALTRAGNGTTPFISPIILGGNSPSYTGAITIGGNAAIGGEDPYSQRGGLIVTSNNALGAGDGTVATGTTITASGWLGFKGNVNYTTNELVTLSSGTQQVTGVIRSLSGNNTFAGTISGGATVATIGVDSGSLTLAGAINTTGGVTKTGAGTLIFNSAQTYSGTTAVRLQGLGTVGVSAAGGTLKLDGAGAIASSAAIVGSAGTLLVDSSTSTAAPVARTASLSVGNNAKVTITGSSANATTDSFGALATNAGGGEPVIEIKPNGQTATAAFASMTRDSLQNGSSNGATLSFRGPNFGQAAGTDVAQATFTTAPGSVGSIIKYATITDTAIPGPLGTGLTRFATTGANGIRQLADAEYNAGSATGGVLNTGNTRLTSGPVTLTSDAAVGSLNLEGNGITLDGAFDVRVGNTNGLNAMLSQGTGNVISTSTIDFGSLTGTTNEANVYVAGDLTINSVLRNGGTSTVLALTKSGPGDLILAGNNTFVHSATTAYGIRINNGTLSFGSAGFSPAGVADASDKNLGDAANRVYIMSGGTLRLLPNKGTVYVPQTISLGQFNNSTIDPDATFINVETGSVLKTQGLIQRSGNNAGGFTKKGPGELMLTGGTAFDRSGAGTSYLAEGTLTLGQNGSTYGGLQVNGWLISSPGTTINFDSSGTLTSTTRLGEVVLAGSRLNITGSSTNASADKINALLFAPGGSSVNITAAGQTTGLTASNSSSPWGRQQGATIVFSGVNIGAASSGGPIVTLNGTATPSGMVGGIVPYALVDNTTVGGDGTAFAAYASSTLGITPVATVTTAISAGGNVRLAASDASIGTVNSLHLNGTGISAGSAGTLTVTSGGVLSTGGANSIDATTLSFGAREGVIHAVSNLTVNSDVVSTVGLTKAGPSTLTLNGANNWSGPTYANGGTLRLNNSLTSSSSVNAIKGTVELAAGGNKVIKTAAISMANGGKINLQDNKLVVTGGDAGSLSGGKYTGVAGQIQSGRNGGTWDGTGIVTTQSNAASGTQLTTLGVASNATLGRSSFGGVSVGASDVLVMYTYAGDANLNGKIDGDDYFAIDSHLAFPASASWSNGDFNYDGKINGDDYFLIDANAGNGLGTFSTTGGIDGGGIEGASASSLGITAVPEPASIGVIGVAAAALLGRRRRRCNA